MSQYWFGDLPSHWNVRKVRELFSERNEKVSDIDYPPLSVGYMGVVPQLETAMKTSNGDNRKLIKQGDFAINSRSDRKGAGGISKYDGSASLIITVLKPQEDINGWYFHYLFRSSGFVEEYYRNGRGLVSDLWTTRYDEMRNIIVPTPPRVEQDQIVRFLDWKVGNISRFIREKRKEISRLNELINTRIKNAVLYGIHPGVPPQESGIGWIGNIPAHWDVRMLSQEATEQALSNKTVHNQNLLSLSYGKIVNKDINKTDGLLPASFDTYQVVNDGNIILRLTDLQNDKKSLRVGLVTQTGIITSAYTCLKPRAHVLPHYLYLLLHSYDVCKVFYGMGGGVRQSIGYNEIRRMLLPLPGRDEQQAIVDYCYRIREQTEQMISALKREIGLVTEYRTRLISDVVTGKIDVRDIEVPIFEPDEADTEVDLINEETDDEADVEKTADDVEDDESAHDQH
ncbi:MAG: restriction endonuclease subunit S [Peptococcaceae bacterium]|nr:restriction endonuclease subunit S [Peptococcaceae bacterium]